MLVILYRKDAKGATWYYSLDDRQGQLFHNHTLTVRWGRSPEGGRSRTYSFATLAEKNRMVRLLMGRKLKTHKVLYSWFRPSEGTAVPGLGTASTGNDTAGPEGKIMDGDFGGSGSRQA